MFKSCCSFKLFIPNYLVCYRVDGFTFNGVVDAQELRVVAAVVEALIKHEWQIIINIFF
jgi:hypothetical protein